MPQNLSYHALRMNLAREEVWKLTVPVKPEKYLVVPPEFSEGVVRCNVYYGPDIQRVIFKKYLRREIRSLVMLSLPAIDYHLKYANRSLLDSLLAYRGEADEIVIVKDGLITDTSMSNLVFYDGQGWFTPAKPLLNGTCRQRLIEEGRVVEQDLRPGDLHRFIGCKLINAMRDLCEQAMIPVSDIQETKLS
jgi:4-amino-4-deoxychorismate lyase